MLHSEKGQALPIVLALLAIGGLVIVPSLDYAATSLNSSRILDEGTKGVYAADAAVEYALWSLINDETLPTQLPENINQMEANIQTEDKGECTLYFGELIRPQPGVHLDWLDVEGDMVDEGGGVYRYIITVTWQDGAVSAIKLTEVGARIPVGYTYVSGSADNFTENLSTVGPDEAQDAHGAYLLNWELDKPFPEVSENQTVQTQTFYITGTGSQEGEYAWVVALRQDVGEIGEITGTQYKITATATRPGYSRTIAKIVAEVMVTEGTAYITSWQISKQ